MLYQLSYRTSHWGGKYTFIFENRNNFCASLEFSKLPLINKTKDMGLLWKCYQMRGWEMIDPLPQVDQAVLIVGPHTSNWDFPLGLAIRNEWNIDHAKFLGKHSLFVGPFGTWLRSIGGIPVNRKSKTGLVEQVVAAFAREPRFLLALSPEGTRSRVDQLKTGFLAIAKGAGVPIIQIGLDAERKQISVSAPWWPSGDDAQDLHRATQFFAALNGYRPAQGLGHLRTTGEEPVLFEQFHRNAERHPGRVFLDEPTANGRLQFTYQEAANSVQRTVRALHGLGIEPGDRIAILAKNSAHWILADLAISGAGAVSVPLYPTTTPETVCSLLEHSGAKAVFLGKLDHPEALWGALPAKLMTIPFPNAPVAPTPASVHSWNQLQEALPAPVVPPQPDDLATIIYTSGTTGQPKGVMHLHRGFQFAFQTVLHHFTHLRNEIFFSYLPMSHVAEKMLVNAGSIYLCGRVHFVQKLETFAHDLAAAQPTVFLAVPRIWEKFDDTLRAKIPSPRLRQLLAPLLRKRLGLSRARLVLSGASSIRPSLLENFSRLGITIQEVYGMTENLGITTVNFTGRVRVGTVGQAFDGVDVRTSSEGEIQVRSGANTVGYYREPLVTAELYDGDFLRTGDLGHQDHDGYWTLTGRIKDQFKTSKGKFVMPIALENELLESPSVAQCCVVGEGLHQPFALVVLTPESRAQEGPELAAELGRWLDQVNAKLPSHEKLLSIVSVPEEWGVDNGFLTPTLKIKRAQLEHYYKPLFNDWLKESSPVVFAHR